MLIIKPVYTPAENQEKFNTIETLKGLDIRVTNDNQLNFIHAQLIIYYNDKDVNPAFRHLTMLNIFNEEVNKSGSGLLNILKRLGGDFTVFNRPDYLLFKINFLPDKLATFMQFLKGLYTYKAFTLKKFNYSIDNYRELFLKTNDWKKDAAYQVAYSKLFPGHPLGNTLIIPGQLKKINLARIRSFYQKTYTLINSLLLIKGSFKKGMVAGSFNRAFKNFKKQERKNRAVIGKLKINNKREVIIYHINSTNPPEIFWFETIPPLNQNSHLTLRVMNDMLFGWPVGRLTRIALNNGIIFPKIESEVINHREVSVICNNTRLNYKDIENFIIAVDIEKRKLKNIYRREYLEVKNYFCGRLKVDSRKFENEVELDRDFYLFKPQANSLPVSISRVSRQVTFESLNSVTPDLNSGTIVIVGNANLISKYLKDLKPEIIRYIQ